MSLTEAPVPAVFAYRPRLPRLRIQVLQKGSAHSREEIPKESRKIPEQEGQ